MERSVIISRENVRPSLPTPQSLQTYKLSMLDQIVPSMLVPLVLYFPNTNKEINDHDSFTSQTTQQLKRSLSLILTRFYPLAGRINEDRKSINCNDQGVPFVVVKFPGQKLSHILKNPDQDLPRHLLPCEITWDAEQCPDSTVALIQVIYFDCGGVAIGVIFWHKLVDALTMANFLNSWANTTRGSRELAICPNYIAQFMFPYKEETPKEFGSMAAILKTGKTVMRRYMFDEMSISKLKAKSSSGGAVVRPTRVEAVSALIWKCFISASLANNVSATVLTHAVNLRRRADPPFPSDCFGNFPGLAAATSSANENEKAELGQLVRKMRDAISKIDGDYVNRMRGDEGRLLGYRGIPEGIDFLSISSWCGFGIYGADFGWGKPVWLTRCDKGSDLESLFLNVVWLMDTRGGGIEAWVILEENYMSVFDNVEELRALASIDPSPLDIPETVRLNGIS
ncbi:hypothetical protein DH2020_035207 [Rehmannia glutinosa]|uniref:Uncharacterized protein n=1 Tax=Rehmannia glutinosa TaxID=99300 RepID=A0ABR0VAG3_REHGL